MLGYPWIGWANGGFFSAVQARFLPRLLRLMTRSFTRLDSRRDFSAARFRDRVECNMALSANSAKDRFSRAQRKKPGSYAGGGLSLRYSGGLRKCRAFIEYLFIGLDIAAGARIDTSKPETQKLFFTGFTIGAEY